MTKAMNMTEVTRLMRAGQLSEATQLIQSQMGGSASLGPQTVKAPMPKMRGLSNLADFSGLPGMSGMQGLPGQASAQITIPEGATWTWNTHQAAGLTKEYRLYVPISLADGADPAGLILLLHGCTQDPDDFARGTGILEAAERCRLIVVAPMQTSQANMNKCWNWFEPRHGARVGGEAAFLTDLTRKIAHDYAIAPDRRFAMGLSAGGAMSVTLGSVFPDDFGAVGCHSGLPNGAAKDMGSAFSAMSRGGSDQDTGVGCRLFVVHGAADRTVTPANAEAVIKQSLREQAGLKQRVAAAKLEHKNVQITRYRDDQGDLRIESWLIDGLAHAWSGGASTGSHTAAGPSATDAMIKFFLAPQNAA